MAQQNSPGPPLNGRRVLVVEDEFFLADDMVTALRDLGAEVIGPASTQERAVAMMSHAGIIDLAVLDINLHGEATYGLADLLHEQGVPFVLASGYGRETMPARFHGVPHWEKPFDPKWLVDRLPEMMRRG